MHEPDSKQADIEPSSSAFNCDRQQNGQNVIQKASKIQDDYSLAVQRHNQEMSMFNKKSTKERANAYFHQLRFVIIILGGLSCGSMFLTRLSASVAMLSMVNHTHLYLVEHPNSTVDDFFAPDYVEVGEFNWTNEMQQTIVSGYMLAYTIPQFLTTKLSLKYGIRYSIPLSLSLSALSCLLTPTVSYWGWQWFFALRLLNGFGASPMMASLFSVIERWVPIESSAIGLALLQFIQTSAYSSSPLISGLLSSVHWKWAFYVPAFISILLAIIWWLVSRDDPEDSPFISQKELDLIQGRSQNGSNSNSKTENTPEQTKLPDLPWYFMFTTQSFYFLTISWIIYCATSGGFIFLLPSYFNRVLKISVKDNGLYNFLVQSGAPLSRPLPTVIDAILQRKCGMSLTASRRVVIFINLSLAIATWSYVAAYHEHQIPVFFLNRLFDTTIDTIVTATLISQFGQAGLSSVVYSMMNTFGNLASVLFCWAVGRFLDYTGESLECWTWVFIVMSAMNVTLFIFYLFLKSEPLEFKQSEKPDKTEA